MNLGFSIVQFNWPGVLFSTPFRSTAIPSAKSPMLWLIFTIVMMADGIIFTPKHVRDIKYLHTLKINSKR
tara:strand:- start:239 stop:448 length:210 start_codon:yes stop_codon:yes gene_type:complete